MGVRFGQQQWLEQLDAWIAGHQSQIDQILRSYHIRSRPSPPPG